MSIFNVFDQFDKKPARDLFGGTVAREKGREDEADAWGDGWRGANKGKTEMQEGNP